MPLFSENVPDPFMNNHSSVSLTELFDMTKLLISCTQSTISGKLNDGVIITELMFKFIVLSKV